jgi:hypothetical protein
MLEVLDIELFISEIKKISRIDPSLWMSELKLMRIPANK